jgi:actin-related protein 9
MSSQQGKWREEQVLIICPGSQTTLAQLGCNELTPPAHRFPTRMFKGDSEDEWRPYHTYKRKKAGAANGASDAAAADKATADDANDDDDSYEWIEDTDSTEGAVYPIQGECLLQVYATRRRARCSTN